MKKMNRLGTVLALLMCAAVLFSGALAEEWPAELQDRIVEEGMWITWPADEINDFYLELGFTQPVSDQAGPGQISREEAISIARSFILEHVETVCPQYYFMNGMPEVEMTESYLDSLRVSAFLAAGDVDLNTPTWHVHFYEDTWLTVALDSLEVRMDAATGEVIIFYEPGGNG